MFLARRHLGLAGYGAGASQREVRIPKGDEDTENDWDEGGHIEGPAGGGEGF